MYREGVDIILGSPWMETSGALILNMKTFLSFSYKKKKITLSDVTMELDSVAPSSKELKGDPSG